MRSGTSTVARIRSGVVIDHIPAGRALEVLRALGITGKEGYRTVVLMNVESRKLGRKDVIKIEGRFLDPRESTLVALAAPTATINVIEDFEVRSKVRVSAPDVVEGLLKCPNPTCITNKEREPVKPRHRRVSSEPLEYRCEYCGTLIRLR